MQQTSIRHLINNEAGTLHFTTKDSKQSWMPASTGASHSAGPQAQQRTHWPFHRNCIRSGTHCAHVAATCCQQHFIIVSGAMPSVGGSFNMQEHPVVLAASVTTSITLLRRCCLKNPSLSGCLDSGALYVVPKANLSNQTACIGAR